MSKVVQIALLFVSLAFASEFSCVAYQGTQEMPVDSGFCWIVVSDPRDSTQYLASIDKGYGSNGGKPEITIVENIRFHGSAAQCDTTGCLYQIGKAASEICPPIKGMTASFETSDILMTTKTPEDYERWKTNIIRGIKSRLEYPSIRPSGDSVMRFASPYYGDRATMRILPKYSSCDQYSHLPNSCEYTAAIPNEPRYAKCKYVVK